MPKPIKIKGWSFEPDDLMTSAEVAAAFRVDPKTVMRYTQTGRLASIKTPGGHHRFSREQVNAIRTGGAR